MIPRTAEYALRVAIWLAKQPGIQPSSAIARATRVPRRYLFKVLHALYRAGLLETRTGSRGGYKLRLAPDRITVLDVVNAVSPIPRIQRCPLGLGSAGRLCPLHRELDQAAAVVEKAFASVTLAHLAYRKDGSAPLCERAAVSRPRRTGKLSHPQPRQRASAYPKRPRR
ncbi:MAG: Rrf2 family transcriptional regulator [Gemmataceae bacterium]